MKNKKSGIFLLVFTVVALALAITIGLLLHYLLLEEEGRARTDTVADCYPQGVATESGCIDLGCLWQVANDGSPWCTFPPGYGYLMDGNYTETTLGYEINLTESSQLANFIKDRAKLSQLTVSVEFYYENTLRIKIGDRENLRYEVPQEAVDISRPTQPPTNASRLYDVTWDTEPQFGLKVVRRSTKTTVFDTTLPGFVFYDQYIQLTTRLASDNVYGFGEHNHKQYRHNMDWQKWTIFTRDVAPVDDWNLYGAQTLYMNLEEDGNANGVVLLNSNAMDVVLQPEPYPGISYHVIGGVLDFYVFLGPSPENVVQQYTNLTGRPVMPPYWALGFQLSRWDYDNLTHVEHVVTRNREAGIPQDVQYGDIDYMESKLDFTYDHVKYNGLPDFVDRLHAEGKRYIIILDHCIGDNQTIIDIKLNGTYKAYEDGLTADVYVRDAKGDYLRGEVWPGTVVYPDFTLGENVTQWWTEQCEDFYYNTSGISGVQYDALWIDMNEPSNFLPGSLDGCDNNQWNNPPYVPNVLGAGDDGRLYDKTICMDSQQHWGRHYDVHNLYGHSMSITTWNSLRSMFPDKRPLVLTRSTFVGTQKYAVHWLGDNQSQWRQIPWTIIGMLEFSLFGFSYTGADICGFWYATTEEMCQRWMQLGAFYPYSRNHNAETWPDQDPAAFSDEMIRVSRDILLTRYKLLPFLYTLMFEAHNQGNTVVRPLLHEFPNDEVTWGIDRQFLWGPSFMISPAMEEGQTEVPVYFPATRWYDYYGGMEIEDTGSTKNLYTPLDKINLHVRGGHIIPWQYPGITTNISRGNPLGLIVALGDKPNVETSGTLYWDDGESFETFESGDYLQVDFTCSQPAIKYELLFTVRNNGYPGASGLYFSTIDIWGLDSRPDQVTVDGNVHTGMEYDPLTKAVLLTDLSMNLTLDHIVEWVIIN